MKRLTAWALAAALVVVAALLTMRHRQSAEPAPVAGPAALSNANALSAAQEGGIPTVVREPEVATAARVEAPRAEVDADTPAAADGSRRFVFDCGNGDVFMVRTVRGEATVFSPKLLGARSLTLPEVKPAPDARYAANDAVFARQGALASFELEGRMFLDCTSHPGAARTAEAHRRGATFVARGHAPEWTLEISRERIELAIDDNAQPSTQRIDFPYREPTVAGARTAYRAFSGTQELVVVVEQTPCNDTLNGELLEATVAVTFENQTWYGCGLVP